MNIKEELEDLKKMTDIISGLNNMGGNNDIDYSDTIKELEKISEKSDNLIKIYYKTTILYINTQTIVVLILEQI